MDEKKKAPRKVVRSIGFSNLTLGLIALTSLPFVLSYWIFELLPVAVFLDLVLLAALIVDYMLSPKAEAITVRRVVPSTLSIGQKEAVIIEAENLSSLRLRLKLSDELPLEFAERPVFFDLHIEPFETKEVLYQVCPLRRGAYDFGSLHFRLFSRLGLLYFQQECPEDISVRVLPDLKSLSRLIIRLSKSTELGALKRRKIGFGTEFSALREYSHGDDVRLVDWRSTARKDKLYIKTFEEEHDRHIFLLLDAGRLMASEIDGLKRFDHALNAALSLATTALHKGDFVGMGVFSQDTVLHLPHRRGKNYIHKMIESVYGIEPELVEPDYEYMISSFASRLKGRNLVVLFTDLADSLGSKVVLSSFARLSPKHMPLLVTMKDLQLEEFAISTDYSEQAIFRRACAIELLKERELALSELERNGAWIVDVAPAKLSQALIDKYLLVKAKSLC